MAEFEEPTEVLVKDYKYKKRLGKEGRCKVYRCIHCSYQLHDKIKVKKHQKKCLFRQQQKNADKRKKITT